MAMEALQKRLQDAMLARDAAKASITDDDRAEIEVRQKLAALEAEREAAEKERRDLELERRLDVAREKYGDRVAAVSIVGRPDTFVVRHVGKAYDRWQKDIASSLQNKKLDQGDIQRAYAVAVVVDWNGETDFGETSLNGHRLIEYLKENSGTASAIVNEAFELAGAAKEERKSAR